MRPALFKITALFVFLILFSATVVQAGSPPVQQINVEPNSSTAVRGNIMEGGSVSSLRWAERSSVACFPGTQFQSFQGNHLLYVTEIPPHSIMQIEMQPAADVDLNLYAYQGGGQIQLPPDVTSVVSCEASYNFGRPNPGEKQQVRLNAVGNGYTVVIGVAGPAGVTAGDFTLSINLQTREEEAPLVGTPSVQDVRSVSGETVSIEGDLESGQHIPLRGWADSSQVACFPATQNDKYSGNHVLYRTQLPANSTIKITVTPDSDVDVSLYALRLAHGDTETIPPNVHSAVCESSLNYQGSDPGKPHSVNFLTIRSPYTILIGVAGSQGLESGAFKLEIEVHPR